MAAQSPDLEPQHYALRYKEGDHPKVRESVIHCCRLQKRLTVKLSGRTQAPDWNRGCTLSFSTHGDTTDFHGPLQRLLEVTPQVTTVRVWPHRRKPRRHSLPVKRAPERNNETIPRLARSEPGATAA